MCIPPLSLLSFDDRSACCAPPGHQFIQQKRQLLPVLHTFTCTLQTPTPIPAESSIYIQSNSSHCSNMGNIQCTAREKTLKYPSQESVLPLSSSAGRFTVELEPYTDNTLSVCRLVWVYSYLYVTFIPSSVSVWF